jgi:plastocyanin
VPYIHATLGTIAEVLGLYIVLVAATKILPKKLRFKRYKPWMRTELALWWLVILIGVSTYYIWYIAASKPSAPPAVVQQATAPEKVSVRISNFQFEPKDLTIKAGTVVEWTDTLGRHTVEADDGSFKSETLTAGGTYEHKFDTPGVFPYFCGFHGDKHGVDMAGVITVESR